jgi:serine/threonine protein kinase
VGASPPRTLGPFRLLELVGRGGFADVWLAERDDPSGAPRKLALKTVDARQGTREGMRPDALLREARLVSWLKDPCIVAVEAADVEGDTVWMAMEYCDGGSVASLLNRLRQRGLPMPPSVAVRIGRDVARALAAAHDARDPDGEPLCVVHRDLKPGNVLLTKAGQVKVCDFGIAKATDETNITGTGLLKGTATYVAPELWHDVRAFSPASDAFALGTLLVEMLTVERLHAGGAMPLVYRRIVEGTGAADAARVQPTCPPLVPLLEQLLERDPAQRLREMDAVVDRLEGLLKILPGPADPGLLLRLLDHADGLAPSPTGLPLRVGHAWQVLVERVLGVDLMALPGPAGADRTWALAMHPVEDEPPAEEAVTGFGPPELRTSSDSLQAVTGGGLNTSARGLRPVSGPQPEFAGFDFERAPTARRSGPVAPRASAQLRDTPEEPIPAALPDGEEEDDDEVDTLPAAQAVSYTDLVPASESRLPPTPPLAPARRPPRRPRRRKQAIPWRLIAAVFVLLGIVVALVVAIAS